MERTLSSATIILSPNEAPPESEGTRDINQKNSQESHHHCVNSPFSNSGEVDCPLISKLEVMPERSEPIVNTTAGSSFNIDTDIMPGYIDINSLVLPNCLPIDPYEDVNDPSVIILEKTTARNEIVNKKSSNNDMDVVFIKQYQCESLETKTFDKDTIVKKIPAKVPLRRNPKRKVQQRKSNVDYDEEIFVKDLMATSPRRSTRFSSSGPQWNFKDWTAEDIHEKSSGNSGTKQLEKLPTTIAKLSSHNTSNVEGGGSSTALKKKATKGKKCNWKRNEYRINRAFATLMHHRLHYVISYIASLNEYNSIINKPNLNSATQDNIVKATELLSDTCKLYCVANDVSHSTLAKYLSALFSQGNVVGFLDAIIKECDRQENLTD